jgi:arylsulfatase A
MLKRYLCIALFFFFTFTNIVKAQVQKPNIILILADDVGYKSLSCNGGNLYYTPNIDTLAQQGMRFTQCYSAPNCSPSRVMLLTGKYNFRNYIKWGVMDSSERTIGNMMKDAGYATGFFGKDQLGGGSEYLNAWGFDEYCVHGPFKSDGHLYKNPLIYTHSVFLPDSSTLNKYGPDIISDSLFSFIDNNKSNPFFVYYPMQLVHSPWSPTPDDTAAFAAWDAAPGHSDTAFFPSMITYMDKKVGQLINKLRSLGIENNTVILFAGDNGTSGLVGDYVDEDAVITGGKASTTSAGTHVPLIAYWPGTINAGTVNNDLIDFTDFLPTIAGVAGIPEPTDYGTLDGVSFSPRLTGQPGTPRNWIFDYFDDHPGSSTLKRWAQTIQYKLYDTSAENNTRLFYDIINDPQEKNPIPDNLLTPEQKVIKQQLLDVINGFIAQGFPLLKAPVLFSATDSLAIITDSIRTNGGSTITASGAIWSIAHDPVLESGNYTSDNINHGEFRSYITGLNSNTTYYVTTYATNKAGTAYSEEISFITPSPAPVAEAATDIKDSSFMANWRSIDNVTSYKLDASLFPSFSYQTPIEKTQGFESGLTKYTGWVFSHSGLAENTIRFGKVSPSIQFVNSKGRIITEKCPAPVMSIRFWINGGPNHGSLLLEGFDGLTWQPIENITSIPVDGAVKIYDSASSPPLQNNFTRFRFSYNKSGGQENISLDDIIINYNDVTNSFIQGYKDLTVKESSALVTGLAKNTRYYYRVRAKNENGKSANSNTIEAVTCTRPVISNIKIDDLACNGINSGKINLNVSGGELGYNWSGPEGFTSSEKNIQDLSAGSYHITVTSYGACAVDTTVIVNQPALLNAATSAGVILCHDSTTTLKVNAIGGNGKYYYSLFNGKDTTAPQNADHFKITEGNYIVIVQDDNHCLFNTPLIEIDAPPVITAIVSADPIGCADGTTILIVNATGGTGKYTYMLHGDTISTGRQHDNQFKVNAGNYTVTVEDDNHCTITTAPVKLQNPVPVNASLQVEPITCEGGTTTIMIHATGGSGKYYYALSDGTNITGPQYDNRFIAGPGNYTVIVEDDYHCSYSEAISIAGATASCIQATVFPNPSKDEFNLSIKSTEINKLNIIVTDMYGSKVYEAMDSSTGKYSFGNDFPSGTYILHIQKGSIVKTLKLIKARR